MSFKYINPGFNIGNLATIPMKTTTDKNYSGGVYLAFDTNINWYLPKPIKTIFVSVGTNNKRNANIFFYGTKTGINITDNGTAEVFVNNSKVITYNRENGFITYYIKIISHAENGEITILENGIEKFSFTGNVMQGADITYMNIGGLYGQRHFANFIISDEYFPPSEKIIALPVANTTATMTDNGDGSYTADEVGESVMQTIDAAKLTQAIGEGNTFTGFSLIGNPAYYDGAGMTHLGAMKGETVKESVALPTNTDGKILASWSDNVKQADIANLSLGWKAQE